MQILPCFGEGVYNQPVPPAPAEFSSFDQSCMRLALEQAQLAAAAGEVPVGAVVAMDGSVVAAAANRTRRDRVVTAHAELLALAQAEQQRGDFRLDGAVVYVTVEPCLMCLGAIHQARVARVVYGAPEPKFGALGSRFALQEHPALHKLQLQGGLLAVEAAALLGGFFRELREAR
jgi:tRNA(adenine34) deaminase